MDGEPTIKSRVMQKFDEIKNSRTRDEINALVQDLNSYCVARMKAADKEKKEKGVQEVGPDIQAMDSEYGDLTLTEIRSLVKSLWDSIK